jgi:hypothetical protein
MAEDLLKLTERLNEVLVEENALLDALDLPAAVGLLERKRIAVAALQEAVSGGPSELELTPEDAENLRECVARLMQLGQENRERLERGLALQTRLIQTIAQAVPRARASDGPLYQSNGSQTPPRPPEAYAFLSQM